MRPLRPFILPALSALVAAQLIAVSFKPGHIRPQANPPQYRAFSQKLTPFESEQHALDRLTFGPRPDDRAFIHRIGVDRWVQLQLHPERIPENPKLTEALAPLQSLALTPSQAMTQYPRIPAKSDSTETNADLDRAIPLSANEVQQLRTGTPDQKHAILESIPSEKRADVVQRLNPGQRRALFPFAPVDFRRQLMFADNPLTVVAEDLSDSKILRAVYSNRQFQELLVDFWFNHFNVNLDKGADHYTVPTYERDSIRPYVFGTFYDLLLATAKSPAMLFYLDNAQSVAPGTANRSKRKTGLNENYGRELLELHTLGVDGGYTQQDVINVARCFTGWTVVGPRKGGGFEYNDKLHDKGEKLVLGHVIPPGGGMNDGLQVLQILAHHPSTAHFISLQLAKRFVADDPSPSLVNRMAETFRKKDGDLREVYLTMLRSPEFWSKGAYEAKVKTPLEIVASALRATDANVWSAFALVRELQRMGEPLYRKVEPTGYSSANGEWVSSAALVERMNFALNLAQNRVPGVTVDVTRWHGASDTVARSILGRDADDQTLGALASAKTDNSGVGIILGSPEFQRK